MILKQPILVQKYGGSSVSTPERMKEVASLIKQRRDEGYRLCVVVSAMGKTTDQLLALAKEISKNPSRRELDMLLSCGERASMALLAMALQELSVESISLTGSQSGIITDDVHAGAKIIEVRPERVREQLDQGKVVIVAGFQGVSYKKEITTLGRGGSDTTAVALAAALDAEACEIYSDVAGVYSADPREVPKAVRLDEISFEEMEELSLAGAKVLNAQAVQLAKKKGIVIHARKTGNLKEETLILNESHLKQHRNWVAIAHQEKIYCLKVTNLVAFEKLLGCLAKEGIMFSQIVGACTKDSKNLTCLVGPEDAHGLSRILGEMGSDVQEENGFGTLSLVGSGLSNTSVLLAKALSCLNQNQIPVVSVLGTPLKATLVLESSMVSRALQIAHARLVEGV